MTEGKTAIESTVSIIRFRGKDACIYVQALKQVNGLNSLITGENKDPTRELVIDQKSNPREGHKPGRSNRLHLSCEYN
jgi:hypothetical protein